MLCVTSARQSKSAASVVDVTRVEVLPRAGVDDWLFLFLLRWW